MRTKLHFFYCRQCARATRKKGRPERLTQPMRDSGLEMHFRHLIRARSGREKPAAASRPSSSTAVSRPPAALWKKAGRLTKNATVKTCIM